MITKYATVPAPVVADNKFWRGHPSLSVAPFVCNHDAYPAAPASDVCAPPLP